MTPLPLRKNRWIPILLATLTLTPALAGCVAPAADAPVPENAAYGDSPYVDRLDGEIRGLTADEVRTLREGGGGGFALPAELNGYPGPRHVLDHADALNLTDVQRREMQRLFDAMKTDAQRVGARVLEKEAALEAAFRNRTLDEEQLTARLDEIARLRAELRAIHLGTHLDALPVLTHEQVTRYNALRGYADTGPHDADAHAH